MTLLAPNKETSSALDIAWVRSQFPSLSRTVNGQPAVFFDGPGGTQVPQRVIDAISGYLQSNNANTGGAYATSRYTETMIAEARSGMADFLNCDSDEIVFGPNMTTLTYDVSRSIGRELQPGDEIVLTQVDHDANVSPWAALAEKGVNIQTVDIHEQDCTIDMEDFARKVTKKAKLVATGMACNAVGTINDAKKIVYLAHQNDAMAYIDAVHYAPHGPIDVRALDCDFLVCSTYKFFGPHMGVLYGKREHLKRLQPYKLRANTNAVPNRWEWGTLNHECIAGITACIEYIADVGRHADGSATSRRDAILAAFAAIHNYEHALMERMIQGLLAIPGLNLYGIRDPKRFDRRCPTMAIRIDGWTPLQLATKLGERGFFTWDGNYYAINLTERLDVEKDGGFLRIGLVHYNTLEEVESFLSVLQEMVVGARPSR